MAKNIIPSREYLKQFSSPLWDLLDLENCEPLTIIEGFRENFPFVVIEMRHLAYGPLSDNGKTAISTFFIVKHLQQLTDPVITQYPSEYQVSADLDCVYLVLPSKKIRPGNWEAMLAKTIQVATTLKDQVGLPPNQRKQRKTYTPVGAGVLINSFWALVCLLVSVVFLICGVGSILGIIPLADIKSESVSLGWKCLLISPGAFWGASYYYERVKKRL
ncbi:hypothetical protein [Undibacterium sp.]|uniref:hypothetical protein n=1 Tax=Undibacterium sp. TaxID=1914977 RepID=UPI003752CBEA